MSAALKEIWDCVLGPRVFRVYGAPPAEAIYQPITLEKWGDKVIHSLYVIWKMGVYTSPILVGILYSKGYLSLESLGPLTKLMTSIGVILVVSYCCRGLGRYGNPTYRQFLATLQAAEHNMTPEVKRQLLSYEFEFARWPVEFEMKPGAGKVVPKPSNPAVDQNLFHYLSNIPLRIAAFVAIHTFGIRLIYPGTLSILQAILGQSLQEGRGRLIEFKRGERFKIKTADGNDIDTMLIDRRNRSNLGDILVVCSEGNAGFYEIGIMVTPIEAGYSTLGWNHPGFAGSTGRPYPSQEQNAMDALVQFAIEKLGYKLENIIFFGWSIGGYTTAWAAMNYPDVKGVVVDATFDDLVPLAVNHMPKFLEPIVRIAIREFVDLNIYEQLSQYPGPVLMVRRTEDEVICLKENDLLSNRGNNLLIRLLHIRYPCLFGMQQVVLLREYLSVTGAAQDLIFQKNKVSESLCQSLIQSYVSEYSKSFPMKIGEDFGEQEKNQLVLFLARKYMRDFKSSHCTNLPPEMFQLPWDVHVESDFVFT